MINWLLRKWALYWRRLVCRFRGHEKLEHETETILAPTGLKTIPQCRFQWRRVACIRCGQDLGARAEPACFLICKDGREVIADFACWRDLVVKACQGSVLMRANEGDTGELWRGEGPYG